MAKTWIVTIGAGICSALLFAFPLFLVIQPGGISTGSLVVRALSSFLGAIGLAVIALNGRKALRDSREKGAAGSQASRDGQP